MAEKPVKPKIVKAQPKRKPKTKEPKKEKITVVEGVKTTKAKRDFAKAYAVTGDKKKSLEKAGLWVDKRNASRLLKESDVVMQINLVRQQIRSVSPLSMEEIKQLGTEAASFSIVDLLEEDGTFDIKKVKARGLGRFIKEFEIEESFDKDGKKTVTTKVKGYDRLAALRMLSLIQRDEENRDIQIVQALSFIFSQHPELLKERGRVFNLFAKRYNVNENYIETVFDKIGRFYMVPEEK